MLDRKYIVPEITIPPNKTEGEGCLDSCIERLEGIKEEISQREEFQRGKLELDLDTLFTTLGGERLLSEMERIVILLCKIGSQIIRTEADQSEGYHTLLQIFELGLFMGQFKDRWLSRVTKQGIVQRLGWSLCETYTEVSRVFLPSKELMSLAQEYILRKETLSGSRCDLCAFALANLLGIHAPSVSLLQRQSAEKKKSLQEFYFLLYLSCPEGVSKWNILLDWVSHKSSHLNSELFYLSGVDITNLIIEETPKVSAVPLFSKIVTKINSHKILYSLRNTLLLYHKRERISTKMLSEILTQTYKDEEIEYTEKLIKKIEEYSPVAAETLTKTLIIFRKASSLGKFFFNNAFIMDRDYAESTIACKESIQYLPVDKFNALVQSEYLGILCKEEEVFKHLVKRAACILETEMTTVQENNLQLIQTWNVNYFISRVFQVLPITKDTLEKALVLIVYFPGLAMQIKQMVSDEINKKGLQTKVLERSVCPEEIEILNEFREIHQVQTVLLKAAKNIESLDTLFNREIDTFTIRYTTREINKRKKKIEMLSVFLNEIKKKEEMKGSSYWHTLLKKKVVLGKAIKALRSMMKPEDLIQFLNQEEDLAILIKSISKDPLPDLSLIPTLIDKLNSQCKYDSGLVLCSSSYIQVDTLPSTLTVYVLGVQKEFAGRQSLVKIIGNTSSVEVSLVNGILKVIISKYTSTTREDSIIQIEDELEKNPEGGWKVSISLSLSPKGILLKLKESTFKYAETIKRPQKAILGEGFKGIFKRVLIIEESTPKEDRLSNKPQEQFYLEHLHQIEKHSLYYKKYALLIESTTPYQIVGHSQIKYSNAFTNTTLYWRTSERLTRYISKLASKNIPIEECISSNVLPISSSTI
ncbi:hypothetical protein NEOKW01_0774 [Nematocida sp. AWRm80]|nr:hypothetical protein NEOKW01_0774 [Nematocida sp. AWRm80]